MFSNGKENVVFYDIKLQILNVNFIFIKKINFTYHYWTYDRRARLSPSRQKTKLSK